MELILIRSASLAGSFSHNIFLHSPLNLVFFLLTTTMTIYKGKYVEVDDDEYTLSITHTLTHTLQNSNTGMIHH